LVAVAVWVLTVAVVAGTGLGLWHLWATDTGSRPPVAIGIAHGIVGAIGLAVLLLALRGPARGVESGVGSFGLLSAAMCGAALLTGLVFLLRRSSVVMAIHAGIAITGWVLLLAWDSLG